MSIPTNSLRRLLSKHSLAFLTTLCDMNPTSNIAVLGKQGRQLFEACPESPSGWEQLKQEIKQSSTSTEAQMHCEASQVAHYTPLELGEEWLGGVLWCGDASFVATVLVPYLQHELKQKHEKRVLATETLERYRELNLIFQAGEVIGLAREQELLYGLVLQECHNAIKADAGILLCENKERSGWVCQASFGKPDEVSQLEACAHVSRTSLLTKERPEILTSAPEAKEHNWPYTAWMWSPLQTQDHCFGGILLARSSQETIFTASDLKLLTSLGWLAVLALENACYSQGLAEKVEERTQELRHHMQLLQKEVSERKRAEEMIQAQQQELLRLTRTDELTGLYNRRFLFERGKQECAFAYRHNLSFCVLMLDVDHFKQINDKYGHDVGDEVLRQIAKLGKQTVREGDIFCRYGGEEFAVLLPRTTLHAAQRFADRLRTSLANHPIPTEDHGVLRITVSIGVSCFSTKYKELDTLLKQADIALYRAKKTGRNCVIVSLEDDAMEPPCLPLLRTDSQDLIHQPMG